MKEPLRPESRAIAAVRCGTSERSLRGGGERAWPDLVRVHAACARPALVDEVYGSVRPVFFHLMTGQYEEVVGIEEWDTRVSAIRRRG